MCSNLAARIDRICGAIEELAERSGQRGGATAAARAPRGGNSSEGTSAGEGTAGTTAGADGKGIGAESAVNNNEPQTGDDVAESLAAIWAMIADADPELAKRLPGYLSAAD